MDKTQDKLTRRNFLRTTTRGVCAAGLGALALTAARGKGVSMRRAVWQIDPTKCTACGNCATHCVLTESAVKCAHDFSKCGRCNFCFGYYKSGSSGAKSHAGVEFQLCPTHAFVRKHVVEDSYEYTIDIDKCTGCGICVKGCKEGNGSLFLQVDQDICTNCNECTIATACPAQAFVRLPADYPYWLKQRPEAKS
ncbi:MAG: 4Fe-4S binding protein [Planctomycetes bacterium]|nr:4Fe-4S binding protein [Planctomycetota bacterium]